MNIEHPFAPLYNLMNRAIEDAAKPPRVRTVINPQSVKVIPLRPTGERTILQAIAEELRRADRAPVLFQADRAQADHDCLEELRTLLEVAGYYQRPRDDGQIDWTVTDADLEDRYSHDD